VEGIIRGLLYSNIAAFEEFCLLGYNAMSMPVESSIPEGRIIYNLRSENFKPYIQAFP
jgi:hypothetical protein